MSVGSASAGWQRLAPWLLLLAALLWLLRDTAQAMVSIWLRSDTFTHAFLVPPIAAWLAWRRRAVLAQLTPAPVPWLLLPVAGACFLWLLGELAAVAAASQFALVTLIVLSVPAVFGWAVARALAFPLAFLYFAVPFGEFTVPVLMEWTADFTVAALQFSGIPVYREGLQFVIPSGTWSVVEACSGVRYLIASFMVGTLFAYLNYRSTKRRVIFAIVSLLVPVLANWLRAYMIVMIGHLSGNELAVGVDHLIYGWVFFGVVICLMFFIGSRWAEPEADPAVAAAADAAAAGGDGRARTGWTTALTITALLAGTQALAWQLEHDGAADAPVLALPAPPADWSDGTEPLPWTPGFANPSAVATRGYQAEAGTVWVWVGHYRHQGPDRKLVTSTNALVGPEDRTWVQAGAGGRAAAPPLPALRTGLLRQGSALSVAQHSRLRVWQIYWVGGRWTTSDVRAKLWQALDRLTGRGDDGAVVLLVTPAADDVDDADAILEKFARGHLDAVGSMLAQARDTR
jgi:exosortase A